MGGAGEGEVQIAIGDAAEAGEEAVYQAEGCEGGAGGAAEESEERPDEGGLGVVAEMGSTGQTAILSSRRPGRDRNRT